MRAPNHPQQSTDGIASFRRGKFLTLLSGATSSAGFTAGFVPGLNTRHMGIDLHRYFLYDTGSKPILASPTDDRILPMTNWLGREDDPERPTFLFPDKLDGPDLLFFLKEYNSHQKVLCSVQVGPFHQADAQERSRR